ncbi:MAG TPA: hypothetical protein VHI10_13375 [Mycobacterium sp.]|nr:hypothetical protein [Mycobacterium sp.]
MAAVTAAVALLAAIPAVPANASPPSYGSNGVFGVTTNPREGWVTAYIQPGRYRVDQSPSMWPYQSAPGSWVRCHNVPCSPSFPGNIIASGRAIRDVPTFMDVLPTDVAVWLGNVTLTRAG